MTTDANLAALTSQLATHALMRDAPQAELETMARACRLAQFRAGQSLIGEGSPPLGLWFLLSGSCRIYFTAPDGRELTARMFQAPALFGDFEALHGLPHVKMCSAVTDAAIALLPTTLMPWAMRQHLVNVSSGSARLVRRMGQMSTRVGSSP